MRFNNDSEKLMNLLFPLYDETIKSNKKENDNEISVLKNRNFDRIMNNFGDTPNGMVESAMEFLRVCKNENFDQIVLSMKSSNPIVMIHAYRLLVKSMDSENMFFPLHLGVTEAGDGLDGRIKSAL